MSVIRQPEDIVTGPGYFRIGFIQLDIPPQDISTSRVANNDEVTPLRAPYAMPIKSGQSRWDVTIRWVALGDDDIGYDQWQDVRYIAAFVKCAPFIEIENAHLRQFFTALDPSNAHARLAFALRQLRVETSPDIVNGLVCTLTMTYFNYYPFSRDFGYIGADGKSSSDAYQSPAFKLFVDTWIAANFTTVREGKDIPTAYFPAEKPWEEQAMGTLELRWRLYDVIPIDQSASVPVTRSAAASVLPTNSKTSPPSPLQVNNTIIKQGAYDSYILAEAAKRNLDPSMIKAVMQTESNFQPNAVQPNWTKSVLASYSSAQRATALKDLTSHILNDEDGGAAYVSAFHAKYGSYPDLGLMQIHFGPKGPAPQITRPADLMDPATSIDLGSKYLQTLYKRGMTDSQIYAYNTGSPQVTNENSEAYARHTLEHRDRWKVAGASSFASGTTSASINTPAPAAVTQIIQESNQNAVLTAIDQRAQAKEQDGWTLDHFTDYDAFFYQESVISLADTNNNDGDNDLGLFPQQFAILFSNNLAQMSLQSYQYPTYQHVGPVSSMVSIGMASVGVLLEEDSEPEHLGIKELTKMAHTLEEQFQRMKTKWRKVSSVHRMQAVRVYNQLLNMLGVHALIINDVSTMTLQDSSNMVQVQMTAAQYENIFEEVGGYLVKGTQDAYVKPFFDYLNTNLTDGLNSEAKNGISAVIQFQQAMKSRNLSYLWDVIKANQIRLLDVPSPLQLTSAQEASLRSLVTNPAPATSTASSVLSLLLSVGTMDLLSPVTSTASLKLPTATQLQQSFPTYVESVSSHTSLSATDLVFLAYLQSVVGGANASRDTVVAPIFASLTASLATQIDQIYVDLLAKKASPTGDPLLFNQMQQIVNSPSFQTKYKDAIQKGGPAVNNVGHGCYRDMGIEDLSLNPGSYFVDYSAQYKQDMQQGLAAVVSQSKEADQKINKNTTPGSVTVFSSDTFSQEVDEMLLTMQAPENRMAGAFPTFKLFLLEENNHGIFYAFDDFYSYASVTEIEIIRYRDRPHQAIIQLTNLAHLLSHKIYDDTTIGHREHDLEIGQGKVNVPGVGSAQSGAVSGPASGAVIGGRTLNGTNYQRLSGKNRTEGYGPGGNQIPLAYYPLAPGNKIEIRMGFSNNPDELFRVFSGTIAEVDGTEIMTIKAQGFQAELMNTSPDKLKADSWLSMKTFLTGLIGGKGPAYGGWGWWGDSGDVGSVIQNMLTCSNAKHFGHWQVDSNATNLMRGYTWGRLAGDVLSFLGSTRIAPALQDSYDRSGQNILINHVINADATKTDTRGSRGFFDQVPFWTPGSAFYYIPEANKAPWDYIKDISRRYPEYILSVKDYGFPHGADATLVFAHPRDSYYSRALSFDENAVEAQADAVASAQFQSWWSTMGRNLMRQAVTNSLKVAPWLIQGLISGALIGDKPVNNTNTILPARGQVESDTISAKIDSGGVQEFDKFFDDLVSKLLVPSALVYGTKGFLGNQGQYDQIFREFAAVQRIWQAYRDARISRNFPLLKPVRKHHFVDSQSIVHNGIVVNDEVLNAVRINGDLYPANQNIPSQYLRVLDATQLIVAPDKNATGGALPVLYAQSFLKEELAKMYRGELVLRGMPSIEPNDVILLVDPGTGMSGPIVVDKVIHSFSQESGYISIVTPMAFISINETSGKDFIKQIFLGFTEPNNVFKSALDEFLKTDTGGKITALALPAAAAATSAIAISGAQAAITGVVGSAAITPVASALPIGTGAAIAAISPISWWFLAASALVAGGGLSYVVGSNERMNTVLVSPLTRFGRPWTGGMQGFEIANWWRMVRNKWINFEFTEIQPLLLSYKIAKGYLDSTQ
jgi:soluble lytic murein transglycosylase-like protein